MSEHRYNAYASHFRQAYGGRLQKLSIDAGFGCPHRDGRLHRGCEETDGEAVATQHGGCTFCNNNAFNPSYCTPRKSITQQLDEGIDFHRHRYERASGYLAYFQAYSNTYAPLEVLRERYLEALAHPAVKGLIIGTRPDCVDEATLNLIADISHGTVRATGQQEATPYIAVEYGIESCYDTTLARINRGHDFGATQRAIAMTAERGIACGGHLILGLPGESRDMMLHEADLLSALPINTLKLHQLQILKGTALADELRDNGEVAPPFTLEEYIALVCDFLERLRPDIMVERLAGEVPPRFQVQPERSWRRADGRLLRNEEIPTLVDRELERRDSHQGMRYTQNNNTTVNIRP
ncbi:MAG: TIGR01212 family radical SAM protein [Bacteroidales bacterium]|nr:TIGR01212 family radical SAM protein [Bacteroidales bacterium]